MLIEKLLLHVLIILAPVFIYSVFLENRRIGQSPYLIGISYGVTAFLCMIFSYYSYGLYWDLRYVPLVLSFLYGGPIAGGIVFIMIIGVRTFIGGEALLFGYISALSAVIVPALYVKKFQNVSNNKRVKYAISIGLWPSMVMLLILVIYLIVMGEPLNDRNEIFYSIFLFGMIQAIAIGATAKLIEILNERNMMKQEIQRAVRLNTIGELAASIAHEVRNPLTVVKGFLQLMQRHKSKSDEYYLELVLSELGRAEMIINDYLNFAKPEFKKVENFSLGDVVKEVLLLLDALAIKQGVLIHQQFESKVTLSTDRNQLKQALVNLIKNAIEATCENGTVTLHVMVKQDQAQVIIKDTGKGMNAEQLDRIGTLFYTTKDKGTGLGTSVSIRIIEAMNGKVTYKSEKNNGTEVTVSLPIARECI